MVGEKVVPVNDVGQYMIEMLNCSQGTGKGREEGRGWCGEMM